MAGGPTRFSDGWARLPKANPAMCPQGRADGFPDKEKGKTMARKNTRERVRLEREAAWAQMVDKLVFLGEMEPPKAWVDAALAREVAERKEDLGEA